MSQTQIVSGCPMHQITEISDFTLSHLQDQLIKKYKEQKVEKTFHTKTIGIINVKIKVKTKGNTEVQKGLFSVENKEYKAIIRFSNGSPNKESDDTKKEVRGAAIKIKTDGYKNYKDPPTDQPEHDIILFNLPIHAVNTLQSQRVVPVAVFHPFKGILWLFKYIPFSSFKAFKNYFATAIRFFLLARRSAVSNVLEEMYFSATPYEFGDRKIKWLLAPLKVISSLKPKNADKDFLGKQLEEDLQKLNKDKAAFRLYVQFQENEKTEPIDEPGVEWRTTFHQVADIFIETKSLAETDKLEISFCPGNAVQGHGPLGYVNAIREIVYRELAERRAEKKNS